MLCGWWPTSPYDGFSRLDSFFGETSEPLLSEPSIQSVDDIHDTLDEAAGIDGAAPTAEAESKASPTRSESDAATTKGEEAECGVEPPLGEAPVATEAAVAELLTKLDYTQRRLAGATSMRCALRGIKCSDCEAFGCCLGESGAAGRLKVLDLSSNAIGPSGITTPITANAPSL